MWRISTHTWILDLILKIQRSGSAVKLNLTSAIGNFSKLWHLASYVSRHNAMAYDTCFIHKKRFFRTPPHQSNIVFPPLSSLKWLNVLPPTAPIPPHLMRLYCQQLLPMPTAPILPCLHCSHKQFTNPLLPELIWIGCPLRCCVSSWGNDSGCQYKYSHCWQGYWSKQCKRILQSSSHLRKEAKVQHTSWMLQHHSTCIWRDDNCVQEFH